MSFACDTTQQANECVYPNIPFLHEHGNLPMHTVLSSSWPRVHPHCLEKVTHTPCIEDGAIILEGWVPTCVYRVLIRHGNHHSESGRPLSLGISKVATFKVTYTHLWINLMKYILNTYIAGVCAVWFFQPGCFEAIV